MKEAGQKLGRTARHLLSSRFDLLSLQSSDFWGLSPTISVSGLTVVGKAFFW